jgi:hypothetical protein
MMARDKKRLYIGFHTRTASLKTASKYHVSLLLIPKNPVVKWLEQEERDLNSVVYHVSNPIDAVLMKDVWGYQSTKVLARTERLAGVMLLGKIDPDRVSEEMIGEVLAGVPVINDDPEWRCHDWLFAAIKVRVSPRRFFDVTLSRN